MWVDMWHGRKKEKLTDPLPSQISLIPLRAFVSGSHSPSLLPANLFPRPSISCHLLCLTSACILFWIFFFSCFWFCSIFHFPSALAAVSVCSVTAVKQRPEEFMASFFFTRWTQRLKVLHLLREMWQSAWKRKCWIGIEYWISLSNTQWPWQFLSCLLYCLDISGLKIKSSPSLAVNSDREVLSNEWGLHHFPIRYFILAVYYNIWLHILVTRYRCELASKTKHVGSWRFEFWL